MGDFESFNEDFSREEVMEWFRRKLNRQPEIYDIYNKAKEFYTNGAYTRAKLCLELYVTLPGALVPGHHLLGYCYLILKQFVGALEQFRKCVKDGYHEDWQMVVELQIEMDELRSKRHS